MSPAGFRVIIVGGGPVGLTAAHMFTQAGIEFVLLEQGPTLCPDRGASLAIYPPTIRIFDQLGLYDVLCANSCPVKSVTLVTHDGMQYDRQNYNTRKQHGYDGRICHRADVLRILFDNLPAESKTCIYPNKRVVGISIEEYNATVTCQDGSIFVGSMILGADGVHSNVRALTRRLAFQESAEFVPFPEHPFTSSFRLVFGAIPRPTEIPSGDIYESHGKDVSTQLMNGKDKSWFFIYQRLKAETQEHASYSEDDVDRCVKEIGSIYMTPALTIRDVYTQRMAAGMVNLEEGFVEDQSWKRVLLIGDSCRKMTPNIGFGFHSAVWDLTVIVNHLREYLVAHPDARISTETLSDIFSRVQNDRVSYNRTLVKLSADMTRSSTWQTWSAFILDRFIFPWTYSMTWMSSLVIAPLLKVCPILDWLPEPNFQSGSVPWACISKSTPVQK